MWDNGMNQLVLPFAVASLLMGAIAQAEVRPVTHRINKSATAISAAKCADGDDKRPVVVLIHGGGSLTAIASVPSGFGRVPRSVGLPPD
jgi:hypothetical protein